MEKRTIKLYIYRKYSFISEHNIIQSNVLLASNDFYFLGACKHNHFPSGPHSTGMARISWDWHHSWRRIIWQNYQPNKGARYGHHRPKIIVSSRRKLILVDDIISIFVLFCFSLSLSLWFSQDLKKIKGLHSMK